MSGSYSAPPENKKISANTEGAASSQPTMSSISGTKGSTARGAAAEGLAETTVPKDAFTFMEGDEVRFLLS